MHIVRKTSNMKHFWTLRPRNEEALGRITHNKKKFGRDSPTRQNFNKFTPRPSPPTHQNFLSPHRRPPFYKWNTFFSIKNLNTTRFLGEWSIPNALYLVKLRVKVIVMFFNGLSCPFCYIRSMLLFSKINPDLLCPLYQISILPTNKTKTTNIY